LFLHFIRDYGKDDSFSQVEKLKDYTMISLPLQRDGVSRKPQMSNYTWAGEKMLLIEHLNRSHIPKKPINFDHICYALIILV